MDSYSDEEDMSVSDKQALYDISNDYKCLKARYVEQEQELAAFKNTVKSNRPISDYELEVNIILYAAAAFYSYINFFIF